jgi:hypothetical protein
MPILLWISLIFLLDYFRYESSFIQSYFHPSSSFTWRDGLWAALIDGNTRKISHIHLDFLYSIGIGHLFSPSASHLHCVGKPLRWLIRSNRVTFTLFISIWFFTIHFHGYECLGRISLVHALNALGFLPVFSLILGFSIDLLIRDQTSSLSFCLSLLFGTLTMKNSFDTYYKTYLFFLFGYLIAVFKNQSYSLLALPLNLMITLLFPYLFPVLVIIYFLPLTFFHHLFKNISEIILLKTFEWHEMLPDWILLPSQIGWVLLIWGVVFISRKEILFVMMLLLPLETQKIDMIVPKSIVTSRWIGNPGIKIKCKEKRSDAWPYQNCRAKKTN